MQQNPPPFKTFARERFDGASLHGQRSAHLPSRKTSESPVRIPLRGSQHGQPQVHTAGRSTVDLGYVQYYNPSPLDGFEARHTFNDSRFREQPHESHFVSPLTADVPFPWRLRASAEETQLPSPTVSQRRQHKIIRNEHEQRDLNSSASSAHLIHHPQLRPFSIAGEHVPRSVSQPNTPSFYPHTQQQDLNEPDYSIETPGSAIHAAPSRQRPRSATGRSEANFTDEDIHLFVEATAGLGPEQSYRNHNPMYNSIGDVEPYPGYAPQSDPHMMFPEQGFPATARTLHQPAFGPYGMQGLQQQESAMSRPPMQRLQTSSSALDLWLQPPSAAPEDEYTVSPMEDELPDYATSQAQAQAEQRVEAARRAKELRRRWEESRR